MSPKPTVVNTVTYTYDDHGNLETAADGAGTITLGYDEQDRLTTQTDVFGLTLFFVGVFALVTSRHDRASCRMSKQPEGHSASLALRSSAVCRSADIYCWHSPTSPARLDP